MKRVRNNKTTISILLAVLLILMAVLPSMTKKNKPDKVQAKSDSDVITLRVCNWEEYMDLGEWDEVIELDGGISIYGENPLYEDFEDWYFQNYGKRVKVEYSCFGTNEDLYNQLTLGDTYDLVCPSEYMIMKLMAEGKLQPLSDDFFDESKSDNYYTRGVSGFIRDTFENNEINGESWSRYAAGYMWGVTGILYNPEYMSREDASNWNVFNNKDYYRRITIKDNVRDSYFAAVGALKRELFMSDEFVNDPDYRKKLATEMNDVSDETINAAQDLLQDMKDNVYAFETDSGKSDIISGKIVANYQWSGDAVYAMDIAEEDDVYLEFAVPEECTNLWFDGWVMLKSGIDGNAEKQQAAEAFINYVSKPENAVRNMNYIGYTSVIAGGDDTTVFEYLNWCYGAEEGDEAGTNEAGSKEESEEVEANDAGSEKEREELVEYPVGFFFTGDDSDKDYVIVTTADQLERQLYAQYPSMDVLNRSAIMQYFDDDASKAANKMWINVRCFNIKDVSLLSWLEILGVLLIIIGIIHKVKAGTYKE